MIRGGGCATDTGIPIVEDAAELIVRCILARAACSS
jgi:hypothetical protein